MEPDGWFDINFLPNFPSIKAMFDQGYIYPEDIIQVRLPLFLFK
jgi:hypothetical protein